MKMRVALRTALVLASLAFISFAHSAARQANEPQDSNSKFELNVNRVLIPVIVRDKQGRAVTGLKQEDFQVFDNDKPRLVSAFTVERRGTEASKLESDPQSSTSPDASPQSPAPPRFIVFLFDDLHLSFDDLAGAQKAGAKALAGVLGGSDMAAVLSLSGNTNSGLTRDRAKLQEAMLSLKSQGNYLHESEACPKIGYYQAYQMERIENIQAFQEARMQVVACGAAADSYQAAQGVRIIAMRVLKDESRDFVASFAAIGEIVHRMGTLPGQRILILVSPGLPILEPEVSAAESRMIDLAAQSNVTVSALDAHGLSATSATAGNENSNEFAVAEVQVAEGALSDLADATGGTFFHNSNDLDSGLKSLTEAPEVVYVLELSLDGVKADGSLHRLKVRVDRPGLDVQARRGYFLPKPEKNKK